MAQPRPQLRAVFERQSAFEGCDRFFVLPLRFLSEAFKTIVEPVIRIDLEVRVYEELHRLARGYMRKEKVGNTMQATALVNEAFLRLVNVRNVQWQDRAHFFAICANIMHRILVDHARATGMNKHGNAAQHLNLDDAPELPSDSKDQALVAVDDALQQLEKVDPLSQGG